MSPHRTFRDDDDREWTVWDVIPAWGERRQVERRVTGDSQPPEAGERRHAQRRRLRGIRIALTPRLAQGWLAFEAKGERRRLAPIPTDWQFLSDEMLRVLWRDAEQMPQGRGRLVE